MGQKTWHRANTEGEAESTMYKKKGRFSVLLAHYKCYCPVQKAFPRVMAHRIYTVFVLACVTLLFVHFVREHKTVLRMLSDILCSGSVEMRVLCNLLQWFSFPQKQRGQACPLLTAVGGSWVKSTVTFSSTERQGTKTCRKKTGSFCLINFKSFRSDGKPNDKCMAVIGKC